MHRWKGGKMKAFFIKRMRGLTRVRVAIRHLVAGGRSYFLSLFLTHQKKNHQGCLFKTHLKKKHSSVTSFWNTKFPRKYLIQYFGWPTVCGIWFEIISSLTFLPTYLSRLFYPLGTGPNSNRSVFFNTWLHRLHLDLQKNEILHFQIL